MFSNLSSLQPYKFLKTNFMLNRKSIKIINQLLLSEADSLATKLTFSFYLVTFLLPNNNLFRNDMVLIPKHEMNPPNSYPPE